MPEETTTGKCLGGKSIMSIADCDVVASSRHLSHDQVFVTEQTPEKVGDVGTKRNAVEKACQAGGYS